MFDYDAFEQTAGHDITLVQGMLRGISTYYCENCGALVQVGGPENGLMLFHVPRGSFSTEKKCMKSGNATGGKMTTLKKKLAELEDQANERLKDI